MSFEDQRNVFEGEDLVVGLHSAAWVQLDIDVSAEAGTIWLLLMVVPQWCVLEAVSHLSSAGLHLGVLLAAGPLGFDCLPMQSLSGLV
jgi:hypothetical protein